MPRFDHVERARGIGPPSRAWEACVLPLNHARVAAAGRRSQCSERPAARGLLASDPWPSDPDFWPRSLSRLAAHEALSADEAAEAMRQVMAGEATPAQLGGFLMALRTKGETVDEIEGLARTMLEFANPVHARPRSIDTCGTGGDRSGTFNISTVSAIVVAGAGVPVAKHGNRAASSHCGSADVLEALGVRIDLDAAGVERCLAEAGYRVHVRAGVPSGDGTRRARPARAARPDRVQLPRPAHEPRPAVRAGGRRLRCRGCCRSWPRCSRAAGSAPSCSAGRTASTSSRRPGLSRSTTSRDGQVRETTFDPAELGPRRARVRRTCAGATPSVGARIARAVLAGEPGPRRDVVLLNAAAALEVAGPRGVARPRARRSPPRRSTPGAAAATLERWVAVSRSG